MAVPRNRTSNSKKNMRRSHHAMKAKNVHACNNCSTAVLPHTVCNACGFYNGKQVMAGTEGASE
jgi:large subunit ribosomal protein L32